MLPESPRNAAPRRRPWPNAVTLQRGALNCCPGGWGTIARWMGFLRKWQIHTGGEIGGKGFNGGNGRKHNYGNCRKWKFFFKRGGEWLKYFLINKLGPWGYICKLFIVFVVVLQRELKVYCMFNSTIRQMILCSFYNPLSQLRFPLVSGGQE